MTIHSAHHNSKDTESTKNEKAIYTTFLIVGSVVIGWVPGAVVYYLVCDDCLLNNVGGPLQGFIVHCTTYALVILKSGVNSYIYAARMHEIKIAVRRMYQYFKIRCCPNSRSRAGHLYGSDQHLYFSDYQRNRAGGTTVSMYSRSTITRTKTKPNAKRKSSDVQAPLTVAASNGNSQGHETGDTSCL
ncbi:hypothetical protein WDU94_001146 [Cyamophila willieti]